MRMNSSDQVVSYLQAGQFILVQPLIVVGGPSGCRCRPLNLLQTFRVILRRLYKAVEVVPLVVVRGQVEGGGGVAWDLCGLCRSGNW
jgi:hypothetical protein